MKSFYLTRYFVLCLLIMLCHEKVTAQCPAGEVEVLIEITPDQWTPDETSYTLSDSDGFIIGTGIDYSFSACVQSTACLKFDIVDTYGDGIIQGGGYEVFYDGNLVDSDGNFGFEASAVFGDCNPGSFCNYALTAVAETTMTANGSDTWYEFIPTETGQYEISTCGTPTVCDTRIFLYSYCDGLTFDDSQESAEFYNDDGCGGLLAEATTNLEAGTTYYIRIGDADTDCAGIDIDWTLFYLGPIIGCMDPAACTYEPLATVNDPAACAYPGSPSCPDGPDLVVVQSEIVNSMFTETYNNTDACYVNEGCMAGTGNREILRFTTYIENNGNTDYFIGATPATIADAGDQWEWDDCHNHWHYEGYAEYVLYDSNGQPLPIGFKNGFCVMDLTCPNGGSAKFNCSNQGITAQCADYYNSGLSCQWIDLTDVADGTYTFVIRVNWDQTPDALGRQETDYSNNWAQVCIDVSRAGGSLSVTESATCSPYTDCLGQIFGAAVEDCAGNCDGTEKAGDLSQDTNLGLDDAASYFAGILDNSLSVSACNDLDGDGEINVVDPVLLLGCVLEEAGSASHTADGHDHCSLPTAGITDPLKEVIFSIGNLDPINQTFDILIENPLTHLLAYQFILSGIEISGLTNLITESGYSIDLGYNANGMVVGLSATESSTGRYTSPTPLIRVSYSSLSASIICLDNIYKAVNDELSVVTATIGNECLNTITDVPVSLSCIIEGPYDLSTGIMATTLLDSGMLPMSQPYNSGNYSYNGSESIASFMPADVVDWVLVIARNGADLRQGIEAHAALLLADGSIVNMDGVSPVVFTDLVPGESYYFSVYHRNHIAVSTSSPILADIAGTSYDFSNAPNMAYGTNQTKAVGMHFVLLGGDVTQDGKITVADFNAYLTNSSGLSMYSLSDCDMNEHVTVGDFNILQSNMGFLAPQDIY